MPEVLTQPEEAKPIDAYWLRMGHLAIDTLITGEITRDLSPEQIGVAAEWFAKLLNESYDMGMRLGEAKSEYLRRMWGASR